MNVKRKIFYFNVIILNFLIFSSCSSRLLKNKKEIFTQNSKHKKVKDDKLKAPLYFIRMDDNKKSRYKHIWNKEVRSFGTVHGKTCILFDEIDLKDIKKGANKNNKNSDINSFKKIIEGSKKFGVELSNTVIKGLEKSVSGLEKGVNYSYNLGLKLGNALSLGLFFDKNLIQTLGHVKGDIVDMEQLLKEEMLNEFKNKKELLIYVHGYNTSFKNCLRDAAFFGKTTGFEGDIIALYWPTRGRFSLGAYRSDERNAIWSATFLTNLINDLQKSGNKKIHLLGHSLGTRLVVQAVQNISNMNKNFKFEKLILTAPDEDGEIFKEQSLPMLVKHFKDIHILCVKNDIALKSSRKLHGNFPRICEYSERIEEKYKNNPRVTLKVFSDLSTDLTKHKYHISSLEVLHYIRRIW